MRCLTCGSRTPEGAFSCSSCGAALEAVRDTPRAVSVPRPTRIARRRALTWGSILGAIFAIQLVGSPMLVLAFALVPVVVYVSIALWIDRFEPEPWWMLGGAFLWGASVATLVSGIVNSTGSTLVSAELGAKAGDAYGASVSAPFIEEITKGLALFAIYLWRRHELNGLLDGIVYASMVGLGFGMTENVQYYGNALQEGVGALGVNFVLRGVVLPFLHPLFTSMTGIGLVLGLRAKDRRTRILAPLLGLGTAMLLHGAWNTNPVVFGLLLVLPVFILMLVLIRRSLRHESAVVREWLPAGVAPPEDVERLSSFRARVTDSWRAFRHGGFRGWAAREDYVGALSDLAFSRYHASRDPSEEPPEPEGARELLASLRREWRQPTTS